MTTSSSFIRLLSFCFVTFTLTTLLCVKSSNNDIDTDPSRSVQVINESGVKILIYWINRWKNDELVLNNEEGVLFGASSSMNSFVTHEFEIQEVPNSRTNKCSGVDEQTGATDVCRKAYFQVNENSDQIITLYKNFTVVHVDNKVLAREKANKIINTCKNDLVSTGGNTEQSIEQMASCIEVGLNKSVEETNNEIDYQKKIRMGLSEQWMNYVCYDNKKENSKEIKNLTYWNTNTQRKEDVKVLHKRSESKIFLLKNFISQSECNSIKDEVDKSPSSPDFPEKEYIVGDTKTAILPSENDSSNVLSKLTSRINGYVLANALPALKKINKDSAPLKYEYEDFLFIQYNGKKAPDKAKISSKSMYDDDEDDDEEAEADDDDTAGTTNIPSSQPSSSAEILHPEFKLHCDSLQGNCDDTNPYVIGDRVGTMIMYCDIPVKGGATTFPFSGVHVKPQLGDALFINYVDVDTLIDSSAKGDEEEEWEEDNLPSIKTDTGYYTKHIGCPVFIGTKSIISTKIKLVSTSSTNSEGK